jgi:MFS family permease
MAGDRHPALLTTLVLTTTITALVSSLGAPLIPHIAEQYGVPLNTAQWTLTATVLVGAVATPVLGRMADGRPRRRVILAGLATVALGSLVSTLPFGFVGLLSGRVLQGVGLGLAPLTIAAAREALHDEELSRAVAMLSVSVVAGAGLGFPVTGLLVDRWGVQGAFGVGLLLSLAALAMATAFIPRAVTTQSGRIDWTGALLLALGTGGLLLAISQGSSWGWGTFPTPVCLVGGAGGVALWGWWSSRSDHPLVELRLARAPGLLNANVTALAIGAGVYMLLTLVVVGVQTPTASGWGLGRSVMLSGLLLVPYSLCSVAGSRVAIWLKHRHRGRALMPVGCMLYVVPTALLSVWHDELWQYMACMTLAGLGSGCTFAALPGLVVDHAPARETGSALAFNQLLRYLGYSLGTTVAVTVLGTFSATGSPTETGFAVGLLAAATVMSVAALTNVVLRMPSSRSATSDPYRRTAPL